MESADLTPVVPIPHGAPRPSTMHPEFGRPVSKRVFEDPSGTYMAGFKFSVGDVFAFDGLSLWQTPHGRFEWRWAVLPKGVAPPDVEIQIDRLREVMAKNPSVKPEQRPTMQREPVTDADVTVEATGQDETVSPPTKHLLMTEATSRRPDLVFVRNRLIADIRHVFDLLGADRLSSHDLCMRLAGLTGRPWLNWKGRSPLGPKSLSLLLRPMGIKPKLMRIEDCPVRGYKLEDFENAR